jgi:hypothetical protein
MVLAMAPRAISRSLYKLTKPVLEKRGTAFAALVAGWPDIVGPRFAEDTALDRLVQPRGGGPGVLHLRVTPALALELQHRAPQVVERINAFLGHGAVARLALTQRPMAIRQKAHAARLRPDAASTAAAEAAAARIDDPELRALMARFGSRVLKRT